MNAECVFERILSAEGDRYKLQPLPSLEAKVKPDLEATTASDLMAKCE